MKSQSVKTMSSQIFVLKILLSCGILAALFNIGKDVLAGMLLKGYSLTAQSMSELSATGSPTRPLSLSFTVLASIFMMAFSVGVWKAVGATTLLHIVAGFILGNAFFGLIATLFFPNRFGVQPEFGTPGVLLMFLSVLCFVLAMVFGAIALGGWMRILSITIPAAYILLAILRLITASSATSGADALIGIQERTMGYSFLVWVLCLAIHLLSQLNS